jgi:hypothetical protein
VANGAAVIYGSRQEGAFYTGATRRALRRGLASC